jgi:hypothetical protein
MGKPDYHDRIRGPARLPDYSGFEVTKKMTLQPYDPERLDALTLRVLDVCVHLRNVARTARLEQLPAVDVHDRKALEWLENLEHWAIEAEARMSGLVMKARGTRLGQTVAAKGKKKR